MSKPKSSEQLESAIKQAEARVASLRAALSKSLVGLFANQVRDVESSIQRELKDIHHMRKVIEKRKAAA
jgi:hypothetical protein